MAFIMQESFDIPVTHRGKDLLLKASVKAFGYTPRIDVEIDGSPIIFEQDEEGKYRAVVSAEEWTTKKNIDVELLGLVTEVLDSVRE